MRADDAPHAAVEVGRRKDHVFQQLLFEFDGVLRGIGALEAGDVTVGRAQVETGRGPELAQLRHQIAVAVDPRSRVVGAANRVDDVDGAVADADHVAVRAELDGGPAVAEDVVNERQTGREIEPVGRVVDRGKAGAGDENRLRLAGIRLPAGLPIETRAHVDRQLAHRRPLVLDEDSALLHALQHKGRRVVGPHRIGHAVAKDGLQPGRIVGDRIVVGLGLAEVPLVAGFEVVRAGHIAQAGVGDAPVVVRFGVDRLGHQSRLGQQVEPGDVAVDNFFLRRQVLQRARKAARDIEQQPRRQRRGPTPLIQVGLERLIPGGAALVKSDRRVAGVVISPLVVEDVGGVDLVVIVQRKRSLARHRRHEVVVQELTAVRVVAAQAELVEPDELDRADPPQPVVHHGSGCRRTDVEDVQDLSRRLDVRVGGQRPGRHRRQEVGPQRRRDVVRLEVLIGAVGHERAAEGVGAGLGDHVVDDAAAGGFGRAIRGLVVDLLEHERVVIHRHVAGGPDGRVDVHAVDLILRLAVRVAAVHAGLRLLKRLGAADIVFIERQARHQPRDTPQVVGSGQHVEHFTGHDGLIERARGIEKRRLT